MNIISTPIAGVWIIEPRVFEDPRGYFFESYNQKEFDEKIGPVRFVQDNESYSSYGVLRGLHYQKPPCAQSKLVRVVRGTVLDVAVDIRRNSPTYGQHPRGFAHGFCVLSETALFQYKCDNFYAPQSEGAVAWNDPALGIDWRIPADKVLLSEKDRRHPLLEEAEQIFDYYTNLY